MNPTDVERFKEWAKTATPAQRKTVAEAINGIVRDMDEVLRQNEDAARAAGLSI